MHAVHANPGGAGQVDRNKFLPALVSSTAVYYVRAAIAGLIEIAAFMLWPIAVGGLVLASIATLKRAPTAGELWGTDAILWAAAVLAGHVVGKLTTRLLPPEQGPAWWRHGLFDGRFASAVPWPAAADRAMTVVVYLSMAAAVCLFVVLPCLSALHDATNPKIWRSWLVADAIEAVGWFCGVVFLFMVVVLGWRGLYLRLRPLPIRPGFAPLLPVEPAGQAVNDLDMQPDVSDGGDALPVRSGVKGNGCGPAASDGNTAP